MGFAVTSDQRVLKSHGEGRCAKVIRQADVLCLSSINEKRVFGEVNASQSADLALALTLEVLSQRVVESPAELAALNLIGHLRESSIYKDHLLLGSGLLLTFRTRCLVSCSTSFFAVLILYRMLC